eukprot:scaffold168469_cov26-Tisochrysis_lutea.AAC.1
MCEEETRGLGGEASSRRASARAEPPIQMVSSAVSAREAAEEAARLAEAEGAADAALAARLCVELCQRCEEAAFNAQKELMDSVIALEQAQAAAAEDAEASASAREVVGELQKALNTCRGSERAAAAQVLELEDELDARRQHCAHTLAERDALIQTLSNSIRDAEEVAETAANAAATAAHMAAQAATAAAAAAAALTASERPSTVISWHDPAAIDIAQVHIHEEEVRSDNCMARSPSPCATMTPPPRPTREPQSDNAGTMSARSLPGTSRLVDWSRNQPRFPGVAEILTMGDDTKEKDTSISHELNAPRGPLVHGGRLDTVPQVRRHRRETIGRIRMAATVEEITPRLTPATAMRSSYDQGNHEKPAGSHTQTGVFACSTCRARRTRSFGHGSAKKGNSRSMSHRHVPTNGTVQVQAQAQPQKKVLVRRSEGGGAFSRLVPVSAALANAAKNRDPVRVNRAA